MTAINNSQTPWIWASLSTTALGGLFVSTPAHAQQASTVQPGTEPLPVAPELGETATVASPVAPYFEALRANAPAGLQDGISAVEAAAGTAHRFLYDGGPAMWAIGALSVATLTIILWKIWRLAMIGAWSKGRARQAVSAFEEGRTEQALTIVGHRRGLRSNVVRAAIVARRDRPDEQAREETTRVAKNALADASTGLRALELISTVAPLLGLLGTVLGMIAAFQALQESGNRADPALLAGGIWEALLTTAAGMAVAIPASAALSWFEGLIDRMRRDVEDAATRIFVTPIRLANAPATPAALVNEADPLLAAAE